MLKIDLTQADQHIIGVHVASVRPHGISAVHSFNKTDRLSDVLYDLVQRVRSEIGDVEVHLIHRHHVLPGPVTNPTHWRLEQLLTEAFTKITKGHVRQAKRHFKRARVLKRVTDMFKPPRQHEDALVA